MKNKILLMFSENIFRNQNINLLRLDEQLQISCQILINKGYDFLVAGDGEQSFEFAKRFSYIFQDKNMNNTEDILDESQEVELIKKSSCIVCFQDEAVKLAKLLNSQYIFINIEDDIEEQFDGFTIESLNAGKFVKKLEELICDVLSMEDNIGLNDTKYYVEKSSNDEFEEYKNRIKKTIEGFINSNELNKAKELIVEYDSIVKDDVNICSMKAVICIIENRLEDAETVLLQGYNIKENNFDILYNLGYLHSIQNNITLSRDYYKKAMLNTSDTKIQESIYEILRDMGEKLSLESILQDNSTRSTSIIILTYNNLEYNKLCIESIRKYTKPGTYEIIVVDNNSSDGTQDWLKNQKDIKIILNNENMGFPKGCNIGIEAAKLENDILLLNNDVIVTPDWLYNLNKCLYSDRMVGAVGAVTNNCSYYQTIQVNYKDIDEMIEFAQEHNKSDFNKWEQRIKLVGFCMLIKRNVVDKIGLLDERFSPGNFEDDDYSYRIQEAGYKLYLCNDTFIHHFGSTSFKKDPENYNRLLQTNSEKFNGKWGFNSNDGCIIRNEIIEKFDNNKNDEINVLEVGCGCGATLIKIKHLYKNANIYGIESNEKLRNITNNFINISKENIENLDLNYQHNFFDYIIFSDTLEKLYNPWKVLNNIKRYLKSGGKVIASIHNIMNFMVLRNMLNGNWTYGDSGILDRKNIRFFTLNEINKMLSEAKYTDIEYSGIMLNKNEDDEKFIDDISILTNNNNKQQYLAYKYIVKAVKLDNYIYVDNTENERKIIETSDLKKENIMPLLTIGIPTYNRANKLDICLNSIFTQIGNNNEIEVLVINNNSTDNTEEIVKKYKLFKNLTYIKNDENIGADRNILKVAEKSQGEFLFWHGDDDVFKENTIMKIFNIIKSNLECGLFFVDVLKKNDNIYKNKGLEDYLKNVSFSGTFMSSIIINKSEYYKIKNRKRFVGKEFVQVYIEYMILNLNPNFCIIYNPIFYYLGSADFSMEYKWAEVFVKNYIDVISYFLDNGLSKESIREEKLRMMETVILPRYKLALKKQLSLNLEGFEDIVVEYYKDEDYFRELYNYIKKLQKEN